MKRVFFLCIMTSVLGTAALASAITFSPSDNDLNDLVHQEWYTWAINWSVPGGQQITEATLTINNVYNWASEDNDHLYIWLLDNPVPASYVGTIGSDIYYGYDNQGGGDFFSGYLGNNMKIADYTDPDDNSSSETLVYDLASLGLLDDLSSYAADGEFGFGFDPDCHYYNAGIELEVSTNPAPEPATMLLLGSGLAGLLGLRRKFKKE